MTAVSRVRQADLDRALKAARRAGMGRVEIEPSGKIIIIADEASSAIPVNEWDEVFDEAPRSS